MKNPHLLTLTVGLALLANPLSAEPARDRAALCRQFLTWKFGMFIHFNMATYHEREWATGHEDPATFKPDRLDCDQWARAARSAGMKYAVLTVKHTGGWCLWDSAWTDHDITAFTNYRNGRGDIVGRFVRSCRKHGLKVGLYYCLPGDFAGKNLPPGKKDLHGLPPQAEGDFVGFIKKQLAELLQNYGPIDLLWIDQYANRYTGPQWRQILQHVRTLQPDCLVIANNSCDPRDTDLYSYEYPWLRRSRPARALPPADNTVPSEVCDKLGPHWFWTTGENAGNLQSAEQVVAMLRLCNSRRANYLLNVAPDRSGRIPDYSVQRLVRIGRLLAETCPTTPAAPKARP